MSSRPMNETPDDRAFETTTIAVVEDAWACTARKLPISYRADFGLYREGNLTALCEIKVRRNMRDAYPTFLLSMLKWSDCSARARAVGIPFLLAVRFDDGLLWRDVTVFGDDWTISHGGRTDRGQEGDMEPVVHIPMSEFRRLKPRAAPEKEPVGATNPDGQAMAQQSSSV